MTEREVVIRIPLSMLLKMETIDDLEDWLCAQDHGFIAEMRRIRDEESEQGKGYTPEQLRREWKIQT